MAIHFEHIVIGKGLVGSAAAKYLSAASRRVAVIGPDEPNPNDESVVYASHYDQARVQRIIGTDEVWTRLNLDSVNQYENIQAQSGVFFHGSVGCLYVNPYGKDHYLENADALGQKFNQSHRTYLNAQQISDDFNCFQFPDQAQGLFESSPAGFINPRQLIAAQLNIFRNNQGEIYTDTVIGLAFSNNLFVVQTQEGNVYTSSSVLLATGSFVNYLSLIPQPLQLKTKSEVVLLVKVNEADARKMSQMPSLLYEIDEDETEGIYLIQPVLYPDGNYYLKIGCNTPDDRYFEEIEQVQHWFREARGEAFAPRLIKALQAIMPQLAVGDVITKKCIISRTAHGRPYIGQTTQRGLFVAGGCNGYSAMCSDAIGNVAAHLILKGHIPQEYLANSFELIY